MADEDRPVLRATSPTRGQVVAIVSGNALEFYDFLSFSFFAVNLARVMFPVGAPGAALLLALLTGSLGFFTRPLGAILFGIFGDKLGRRPTMLATFVLMGFGALGLALTPSYAQIGIAAPILVVLFRLLQGLAAGGDVGPSTAFLSECTSPENRGFYSALQLAAMRTGAMLSGLVGLALASTLSQAQLDSYGWRIAFGIGTAIVPFVFLLRRRLDETLHLPEADPHAPIKADPRHYAVALVGVFGNLLGGSMTDFMHAFASAYLKADARSAYAMVIVITGVQAVAMAAGGAWSDRIGRRRLRIVSGVIGAVLALPLFELVARNPTIGTVCFAACVLSLIVSLGGSASYAALVDVTPKTWRSRLVGIGYGLIVALSFGLGPPIATFYLNATGDLRIPGAFWAAGCLLMAIAGLLMPETAPRKRTVLPAGALEAAPAGG